jgi:hypothetical protein
MNVLKTWHSLLQGLRRVSERTFQRARRLTFGLPIRLTSRGICALGPPVCRSELHCVANRRPHRTGPAGQV